MSSSGIRLLTSCTKQMLRACIDTVERNATSVLTPQGATGKMVMVLVKNMHTVADNTQRNEHQIAIIKSINTVGVAYCYRLLSFLAKEEFIF